MQAQGPVLHTSRLWDGGGRQGLPLAQVDLLRVGWMCGWMNGWVGGWMGGRKNGGRTDWTTRKDGRKRGWW